MSQSGKVMAVVAAVALTASIIVVYLLNRTDQYEAEWFGSGDPRLAPVVSSDGRTVTLSYTGGRCDKHADAEVVETPRSIRITIKVTEAAGGCEAIGIIRKIKAKLAAPVADRRLIDGARP